jgi:hypothetical protein
MLFIRMTAMRLFIDGIQVTGKSTSGAKPDTSGAQPIRIGADSLFLNKYFNGRIDEVRLWNRALTTQEVAEAYSNGMFNSNEQIIYEPFSDKIDAQDNICAKGYSCTNTSSTCSNSNSNTQVICNPGRTLFRLNR